MFTRRAVSAPLTTATRTSMRRVLTNQESAGLAAGATTGLLTGNPMTALMVGGGTLLAFGLFQRYG
jgi:hypothetical protein